MTIKVGDRLPAGTLSEYIEVEDTGTSGTVQRILHGLGRIPRGVRIVNVVHRLRSDGIGSPAMTIGPAGKSP